MKKYFNFLAVGFITLLLYSFTPNSSYRGEYNYQYEQYTEAYIYYNGDWVRGQISYQRTQNGFIPLKYAFGIRLMGAGMDALKGDFYSGDRFIPLNPNNDLAIQNNWTHMIRLRGDFIAYMTLY